MSECDLSLLEQWVALNREVLVWHWDGDLEYTEEVLAALRPVGA
jgi:hypothetical protein